MSEKTRMEIPVTIGICAYNEERNIGELLRALLEQRTRVAEIQEILVVASGCTDKTPEIVESLAENDGRIRLILQEERRGKASAINEILRDARSEVIVLESADTMPSPEAIELLVRPFRDSKVGVVAARPLPVDDHRTFWGGIAHALWELHHQVSLQVPKTGEMFAFRHLLEVIPDCVGADEDWIRHSVESEGYRVVYEPLAVVHNSGPKTLDEFLKQRVRCDVQGLHQSRTGSFVTPTWRTRLIVNAFFNYARREPTKLRALLSFSLLETMARAYSFVRVTFKSVDVPVWEELSSTKFVNLRKETEVGSMRKSTGK
ncbi:MAG: glycosyltransferase [Thermoplasmata archaeon]